MESSARLHYASKLTTEEPRRQAEGICCIASSVKMGIKVGSMPHGVMGPLNYFFNFHTLLSCYSRLVISPSQPPLTLWNYKT
jgi:hypothetical protein